MTEWGVVGVIIALCGFGVTIIKPIVTLTGTITKLTTVVEGLQTDFKNQRSSASESHRRLWEHNTEQDKKLADHGVRIERLEEHTK